MQSNIKLSWKNTMFLMAGLGLVCSSAASAATEGVTCSIGKSSVWSNGFTLSDIAVTNNTGAPIDEWEVQIKLGSQRTIVTNDWSGLVRVNGDIATIRSEDYNGRLDNGESTTFGFTGNYYSKNWDGASCLVVKKGIDSSTGYAENYEPSGDEMTLDFDHVSWNVVNVSTADELTSALKYAVAGDKIIIASGLTYTGNFKLSVGGSQDAPIWIVGEKASDMPVLDGGDSNNSTSLAIKGADDDDLENIGLSYVYIQDIAVTNSKTGIAVDQGHYVTIDHVEVYNVGQAGIHIRDGSKNNIIKNSYVHNTGLYNVKYGEGIYIGSDYTKWPGGTSSSEYNPAVDYVQILNNKIGPYVTAEHIDVKEGSSHAYIIGNTFDAEGMNDILNGGLSYIDFKGNYTEAAYNVGDQNDNEYFANAFEINDKQPGWGLYNNIHDNTLTFNDEYYSAERLSISLVLPQGSLGTVLTSEKTYDPEHWVVQCNVDDLCYTNEVSNNTRILEDATKMYEGDVTEY